MRIGAFELIDKLPSFQDLHVIAMLRPWIDVGNVGTIALNKLEKHFGAKELGRLARPGTFFDFSRYRPIARNIEGKRSLSIPNSIINYAIRDDGPDLLFFHILEPQSFGEDYTDAILEVLDSLKIDTVHIFVDIHCSRQVPSFLSHLIQKISNIVDITRFRFICGHINHKIFGRHY